MNRHFPNSIENLVKFLALQDDTIRHFADITSKAKTLFIANQICNHRAYCERMPFMIASNMYSWLTYEQRKQLVHFFHHQTEECDRDLQKLSEKVLCDRCISNLANWGNRRKR